MAAATFESDRYQAFIRSLSNVYQNPSSEETWTATTAVGLGWIVLRIESDLEPLGSDCGYGHLFCDKGLRAGRLKDNTNSTSITYQEMIDLQSFLLRLISFKPRGIVQTWRDTYEKCILNCPECAVGHDACLSLLKEKWLSMFYSTRPQQISTFINAIHKFLVNVTGSAIQGIDALDSDKTIPRFSTSPTLIPSMSIILSKPQILTSMATLWQRVSQIVASQLASAPIKMFHHHLTLPGFILLSMSDNVDCARFARSQLDYFASQESASTSSITSGPTGAIVSVMAEVAKILNRDHITSGLGTELQFLSDLVIHPTRDNSWLSLASILPAMPSCMLSSLPSSDQVTPSLFGLPQLILDHITDFGEHLPWVYSCWGILLRRTRSFFWSAMRESLTGSSGSTLTHIMSPAQALKKVFESKNFLSNLNSKDFIEKCIEWLLPLIQSVADSNESSIDCFNTLQKKLIVELNKPSFDASIHIGVANLILAVWQDLHQKVPINSVAIHSKSSTTPPLPEAEARTRIQQFLKIFLPYFVDLAYGSHPQTDRWGPVQSKSQEIIEKITFDEAQNLSRVLQDLSKIRLKIDQGTEDPKLVDLSKLDIQISKSLWIKLYGVSNDHSETNQFLMKVSSLLIRSLSNCTHIDLLAQKSWLPQGKPSNSFLLPTITALNNAVSTVRAPLVDALLDLLRSNYGSRLLSDLMSEPSVMKATVILIFSPNDGLHMSSLALVRQWSDCTSRLDCLRVLLSKGQKAVVEGLLSSLQVVDLHTKILPDAMCLARRFVRCMTDVIEILCSRTNGLLRDQTFVECLSANDLVQSWALMCSSVASIFTRTPHWAAFWKTSEMTDWMQDALIFSEKLVQEFQTFEAVASGRLGDQVSENDALRSRMVDSFMKPTESLTAWLRLNDPDLLDRSARVLVQMLEKIAKFRRPLNPALVDKLAKYIDQDKSENKNVILTAQQCVYIKNALATHPDLAARFSTTVEDDEEIETLEAGDIIGSLASIHDKQQGSSNSQWGNIFPQMKSSAEGSVQKKGLPQHGQPQVIGTSHPSSKQSHTHQLTSMAGSSKPVPKKNYGQSSLMNTLRLKASRPVNHKPRPPVVRPSQVAQSSTLPNHRRTSGPNFGQPPMRNFRVNPWNKAQVAACSSSDDDSEDGNQEATGLMGLAQAQKGKVFQSRKLAEPRRIKMYDDPALEKQRQAQQAKQERQNLLRIQKLKMQPDFTSLHRYILQWDYNHTGPCPPNSPSHYDPLPPVFSSFSNYLSHLEPLLMCESWQQICQAKESVTSGEKVPIPCEVIGRTSVDDFVEIYTTVKHGLLPERTFFTESDIVLIRSNDPQSHSRCILSKVISLTRKPEWFELNLRVHFGSARQDIGGSLVPKTKWDVIHLCSLSTTYREWAALRSLPYLSLANDILEGYVNPPGPISQKRVDDVMKNQKVNEPQSRAIISALDTPGFSLIQGPPGTGKTSTIVGLVGAFIANRPDVTGPAGGPTSITKKILLCAPSNAAVDEVAKRLKEGVRGARGELIIPKLVRIGADSKVNLAVKDIFIDELVEVLSKESEPGKAAQDLLGTAGVIQDLRQKITELRDTRDHTQMEAERLPKESPQYRILQDEVSNIRRKIHELSAKIDQARDQHDSSKRFLDAATRKLRLQVLQEADVVCSTLSGSGHDYMSQLPFDFETVVIDEACQCVEPASLIPLRYNATQCILVGDPMQLPPTVLSQTASRAGYDQSLFVRMQTNAPDMAHLLSIQYRMHPSISTFPSNAFYASKLLDGPEMEKKTAQPWHESDSLFPPYAFYHPVGAREERGPHHSILNRTEASLAVAIYWRIVNDYPTVDFSYRVGIITGYAAQVGEIRRQLRAKFPANIVATIDVNTVDGFQGQEKDIIILSCVRGGKDDPNGSNGGIGFLKDIRRMNVALTRARSSMFIIGNQAVLSQDSTWKSLLDDASQRGVISEVTSQTFYSTASIPAVSTVSKRSKAKKPRLSKEVPPINSAVQSKPALPRGPSSAHTVFPPNPIDSQPFPPDKSIGLQPTPKHGVGNSQDGDAMAKMNLPLKRKLSMDGLDQRDGPSTEPAQLANPLGASSVQRLPPPRLNGGDNHANLVQRASHGLPGHSGPGPINRPYPGGYSQRPKPPPQLFIPKRPVINHQARQAQHQQGSGTGNGGGNRPDGAVVDNRSVKQRIQDQYNLMQRPRNP